MPQVSTAPAASAAATAPSSVADAAVQPVSEVSGDVALNDTDSIVSALGNTDQEQPGQAKADTAHSQEGQALATDGQQEGEKGQNSEGEQDIPAPQSWGKDAKELFASLPSQVRQEISRREAERESLIGVKSREVEQAKAAEAQLFQYAQTQLGQAIAHAKAAIEGEFAGVNWIELKKNNPQTYLQLEAIYQERMASIAPALQQAEALEGVRQQKQQQEAQQHLAAQLKEAVPALAAIVGEDADPAAWRNEAVSYLQKSGVPNEHIGNITHSYQLLLIAKAMKYDAMQAQTAEAKQKIAQAPKMMTPGAAGAAVSSQKQSAMAHLRKNPKDTSAIAALIAAGG